MKKIIALTSTFLILFLCIALATGRVADSIDHVFKSKSSAGSDASAAMVETAGNTVEEVGNEKDTTLVAQQSRQPTLSKPEKLSERELKQWIRMERQNRQSAIIHERYKNRIKKIALENPIAPIVLPLYFQRLEERSQGPLPAARYRMKKRAKPLDVRPQLTMMAKSFQQFSPAFKRKYFHPRYRNLAPNQRVDLLQLGKDLLKAIQPDYENVINRAVIEAFPPDGPKFQWNPSRTQPATLSLKSPAMELKTKTARPRRLRDLKHLIRTLRKNPSRVTAGQFQRGPQWKNFDLQAAPPSTLHQAASESLGLPIQFVPDLNNEHHDRKYYRYDVKLSSFKCRNQDEWVNDEPYWHLTSIVPRFDSEDVEFSFWLSAGELYNTRGWTTRSYSIDEGEEKGFRKDERRIFRANTYHTSTTFTVSLWEEDWSKAETKDALEEAVRAIRNDLEADIKKAVLDALKDALAASLMETYKEIAGDILKFFKGAIGFDALMNIVQANYGGVDSGWLALELIFSGKDLAALLAGWSVVCGQCAGIILAIKVAGPFVLDLLQGDFKEAIKGLVLLPYRLFETVIQFFIDIYKWFTGIMVVVDPDDFLGTVTVTIDPSHDNIYEDAEWDFRHGYGMSLSGAEQYYQRYGYGPTEENHSLISQNRFDVPAIKLLKSFSWNDTCAKWGYDTTKANEKLACQNTYRQLCYSESPLAAAGFGNMYLCEQKISTWDDWAYKENISVDYTAFYTVRRDLVGGRETFGYTVHPERDTCIQYRTYEARSNRYIKISVVALNSADAVPIVTVSNTSPNRSGVAISNLYADNIHEFYLKAYQGEQYEVQIWNGFFKGSLYGYITLEEKEQPDDLGSIKAYNFPDYYIRHRGFLGEISRLDSTLDKKDATFRLVPGLADEERMSLESVNYPGYFLCATGKNAQISLIRLKEGSHSGGGDLSDEGGPTEAQPAARVAVASSDVTKFWKSATFNIVPGLAGSGFSFKSLKYANYYIRHRNFKLYLESGSDNKFKTDATFYLVRPKWPEMPE